MPTTARTSMTDPLRIGTLEVGVKGGAIGVTFAPGKQQAIAMSGSWKRDLQLDLHTVKRWGAQDIITLLEADEMADLGVTGLPSEARRWGFRWLGLPITDGEAPDARFLTPWETLGPELASGLWRGRRVLVHCKGGLGRAGTVACLLLLDAGVVTTADAAMSRVRAVRPGAIESVAQEAFLSAWQMRHLER
jgi:ADP-ribosyl-[dinitrogen reductase] hydrolase